MYIASYLQSLANRTQLAPASGAFSASSCRRPERPTEGFFHFNTEFSPMASPAFESGRPPESAIELGRIVERGLRESKAIDTEALCIVAGVKVRYGSSTSARCSARGVGGVGGGRVISDQC